MTLAGEGRSPARSHMLELAGQVGVSRNEVETIIEEVEAAVSEWKFQAGQASVSPITTGVVETAIARCLDRL